ncbi:MAG: gamma-glutamylcyclotransferase family protein [Luteolibacter sp.]
MKTEPVFVYGTLRRGASNHFRMAGAEFVGDGTIAGRIHFIDSHPAFVYPALVCGGNERVVGELFLVEATKHLAELDRFEGINPRSDEPDEYRRIKVEVKMDSGESRLAWVWDWAGDLGDSRALEGGDWMAFSKDF